MPDLVIKYAALYQYTSNRLSEKMVGLFCTDWN